MSEMGLSKEEIDFVTEAATIGAGNVATAFSQMLGCNVDLPTQKVHFLSDKNEVSSILEGLPSRAIVARIGLVGEIKGDIFYAVKEGDVRELIQVIEKTFFVDEKAGILEISVMEETANIITGVYLSAINSFCGLNVNHAIPVVSSTSFQAMLDEIEAKAEGVIAIIDVLLVAGKNYTTYLFVILSIDALRILSLKITEARRRLEIKELEENIVMSKLEFHTVLETAGDAIVSIKPRGEIYLWNKKAEEMFGYSAEEAIGKDIHALITPERCREKAREGYGMFLQTGTGPIVGKTVEMEAIRKDGTEFPVGLSISAMNIKGEWHSTGIIRDITERKKSEATLLEQLDELQRWQKATVGRELRMHEIKEENEKLKKRIEEMEEAGRGTKG